MAARQNIEHLDIFVEATATGRREWTYRTQHVQHPSEGVIHAIFLAFGGWQDEVVQGLRHLLYAAECADRLQLQTRPDLLQKKTVDYCISLAGVEVTIQSGRLARTSALC